MQRHVEGHALGAHVIVHDLMAPECRVHRLLAATRRCEHHAHAHAQPAQRGPHAGRTLKLHSALSNTQYRCDHEVTTAARPRNAPLHATAVSLSAATGVGSVAMFCTRCSRVVDSEMERLNAGTHVLDSYSTWLVRSRTCGSMPCKRQPRMRWPRMR